MASPTSAVFTLPWLCPEKKALAIIAHFMFVLPFFILLHPDWLTSILYLVCFAFYFLSKPTSTRCHQVPDQLSPLKITISPGEKEVVVREVRTAGHIMWSVIMHGQASWIVHIWAWPMLLFQFMDSL